MEIERKFVRIGNSVGIIIPKTHLKHLNIEAGDIAIMKDDEGKHGNFISIWRKNDDSKTTE